MYSQPIYSQPICSQPSRLIDCFANRHANHHDHSDNIDLADLVLDTEHILDDLDIYTERELESMNVDEKVGDKLDYVFSDNDYVFLEAHILHCRYSPGSVPMIGIWTTT